MGNKSVGIYKNLFLLFIQKIIHKTTEKDDIIKAVPL